MSRDILHRKAGAGDGIGKGRWSSGRPFEKSAHLFVKSPVKKAFLSTIQADLFVTSPILKALCRNVLIPGIFRFSIEVIIPTRKSHHCWGLSFRKNHAKQHGGAAILTLMAAPHQPYAYTFFMSQAMFFPRSFIVWMPSSSLRTSPISRPRPMLQ